MERSGQLTESKDADGRPFTYQNVRVVAKITQRFNMRPYPAENHALELLVEDSEERIQKVLYVADTEFSQLGAGVKLPGWEVSAKPPEATINAYPTNFGNRTLNNGGHYVSEYSQFRYFIDLRKPVLTSIVKSLWPHLLGHHRGDTGALPQTRVGRAVRSGHRSDLRDRGQQIHHYLEHPRRGAIRVFRCSSNPVSGDRGAHNRRIHLGRPPRGARDSL